MRGETKPQKFITGYVKFQSTLPMRGETEDFRNLNRAVYISIHSPHAGRDGNRKARYEPSWHFNPLSPCGERPLLPRSMAVCSIFQSTLPMRGETIMRFRFINASSISIHSPHAGRDFLFRTGFAQQENFNPLSPCGERLRAI